MFLEGRTGTNSCCEVEGVTVHAWRCIFCEALWVFEARWLLDHVPLLFHCFRARFPFYVIGWKFPLIDNLSHLLIVGMSDGVGWNSHPWVVLNHASCLLTVCFSKLLFPGLLLFVLYLDYLRTPPNTYRMTAHKKTHKSNFHTSSTGSMSRSPFFNEVGCWSWAPQM